jgi:NAD(P)-dependent dehydrogenase (short-subunit alcohol dehydrogenase family)
VHTAFDKNHWALILGGSSGFGLATAKALAHRGMNVCVVHRDRKGAMPQIEPHFKEIQATGVGFVTMNTDALSPEGRKQVLDELFAKLNGRGKVRLMLHSIAFGNLKPLANPKAHAPVADAMAKLSQQLGVEPAALSAAVKKAFDGGADVLAPLVETPPPEPGTALEDEDFNRTVHAMGTSLATWTQDVFARGLFASDARVIGLTSEGNQIAWRGYAAVAAAKVALESISRAIAVELGPYGVRSNIVQAGVTDTPALRLIPGSAQMKADARLRNPLGRLTTPADVADFICLLASDEARWVNGALIRVDGGEGVAG